MLGVTNAPVLTDLFTTTWSTAPNNSTSTSDTVTTATFDGWTLITTGDTFAGGANAFEFWNAGTDRMTMANGSLSPAINVAPGSTDNNILELNNGTSNSNPQTLGITRTINTVAGQVYDLSFDYAGRYGYSTAFTKITVTINGVSTDYANTSGTTALTWHSLDFGFVGTGSPVTITIAATPTQVEAGGRGALIDNISVDTQSGLVAGNAVGGTKTDIALSTYITNAQLTDTDGSETLSVRLTNVPTSAQILVGGVAVAIAADHSVSLTAAQLASAVMRFDSSVTGHVNFNVAAVSTETSTGATSASATQAIDLLVLAKMTVDAPAIAQVAAFSAASSVVSDDTTMAVAGNTSSWQAYTSNFENRSANTMNFVATNAGGVVEIGAQSGYNGVANPHSASQNPAVNWVLDTEGGNAAAPSSVQTTLAFAAGQVVEISMDSIVRNLSMAPAGADNTTQAFNVVWNGTTIATIDPASASAWEADTVRAVSHASGSNTLAIVAVDSTGGIGAVVDNINVVTVGDAAVGSAVKLASLAGLADFGATHSGESNTLTLNAIPVGATITDGVHSFTATAGNTSATLFNLENSGAATGGSNWDLAHLSLTDPGYTGTIVLTATATTTDPVTHTSDSASTVIDATFAAVTPLTIVAASSTPGKVFGSIGDVALSGNSGADLVIGGHGNDTLAGGGGVDVFKWELSDRGTAAAPAADRITDFDNNAGGDKLDLRDLLLGEHNTAGSLQDYLHFSVDATGSTKIEVSSSGGFAGGTYAPTAVDQTITLSGVNLVGSFTSDAQVINDLIARSKIVVDA